jgi:glycosyltransferase involved in cell wall biosynthesis
VSAGKALVIVPTYNEKENIAEVARRLFASTGGAVEMLVVDDGSPDGTADEVRRLGEQFPVHLIERPAKAGLGTAYVAGFRWALERGYEAVVEMDADLSHDPGDVPRLLETLEERNADLVIGSRYVTGGRVDNWSLSRRALSRAGNVYAKTLLRFGVRDSTSGFRAYRADALRRIDLDSVASEGYAFQIEMALRIHRAKGTIREVPIAFTDRTSGKSKMSRRIALEALERVTGWALKPPR